MKEEEKRNKKGTKRAKGTKGSKLTTIGIPAQQTP